MQITRLLILVVLATSLSLEATAPPHGEERLRELVVFPQMDVSFNWGINFQEGHWVINQNVDLSEAIAAQREDLKRRSDDVEGLMHLAYLLDSNDETNESQSCYQEAERLCRHKIAANPQDGLILTELGRVLDESGNKGEAEHCFRKATLISSNDWRCWVGLGNFLSSGYFWRMFPSNYCDQILFGKTPSEEVLNYWPTADAFNKAESACQEASQCFDRAVVLAPKEPEVFFQRAGYMSSSNGQACFFRHYRDFEVINRDKWLLAFSSRETITNLYQAAELEPKGCEYLSLAAFFEVLHSAMESHLNNGRADSLSEGTKTSIHGAMARLRKISEDSDKKLAAEAFEDLGMLNVTFDNKPDAIVDFRRAVALDPTRKQSWDLLLGTLFDSAPPDELLAVAQVRLKTDDSARNHIVLSKILAQKMSKWKEAAEQAEIANKLDTNSIVSFLMLGAIALKQTTDTNGLSVATKYFANAKNLFDATSVGVENRKHYREFMLDVAILNGVKGTQNGNKVARLLIETILKNNPNDREAKDILAALN